MRQLGELNKNGAKEFKELGVEVVAVFREEREGLAGLKKIKGRTKVDFTLALDTPSKATAAYSNGRKEFDNYVVDKNGVIQAVLDGSLRTRAQAVKLLEVVKAAESDSVGSTAMSPVDNKAAVQQAVLDFVDGIYQSKVDMVKQVVHADVKVAALGVLAKGKVEALELADLVEAAATYGTGDLASAKLTSAWGTDMIHLVKVDGKWKIIQILQLGLEMNSK